MRICCALACNAPFFSQAAAAIETIRRFPPDPQRFQVDIGCIAINLQDDQTAWLARQNVHVVASLQELPRFADAPEHAYAVTCRPQLPWIMPGYDGYIWVDSDIRFLAPGGLQFYAEQLGQPAVSVVAAQEGEPAYRVNADPVMARQYYGSRFQRLVQVHGEDVARYCQYFPSFNAGLFAAAADSPVWTRYRRNLGRALTHRFDPAFGRDALTVTLVEVGRWMRAPAVMNWLCYQRMPVKAEDGTWRVPAETGRQIFVAHLNRSSAEAALPEGRSGTYYDVYRSTGLTE